MHHDHRDYGSHARQLDEQRERRGMDPEDAFVDRLMSELDARDMHLPCRLPAVQQVLFTHAEMTA